MRRILSEEMERTPLANQSLKAEYELSLPESEFQELRSEPHLANGVIATSTFAATTLLEHGVPNEMIHVVPYGVDGETFSQRVRGPNLHKPFKVVYVGSLIQRKGISYLLDAVRLLKTRKIQITLCVHGFVDSDLLERYGDLDVNLKLGLSGESLASEIHNGDVFVFPSLAEGFGLVILEAMSCGLPVITTNHTGAPDVMIDGQHGFIVPIRDAQAIAERISWGIDNREALAAMGNAAAAQARLFTWERFRADVREAYKSMVAWVA
jgi:glycosyltransferase involved in cell wall biosynthesis